MSQLIYLTLYVLSYSRIEFCRKLTLVDVSPGGAMTCVRRKSDNKPCHIYMMKKLDTVFKDVKNVEIKDQVVEKKGPDGKPEKVRDYFIVLETRGIVEGVRLSDQEIGLKSEPLVKVKVKDADQ